MIYHAIIMPINNSINCVFFCGTAGAIRRSAFDEVGGWNADSITEDSELSVKMFIRGYRSVYIPLDTPSEVPDTFESFVRQQMRWCYGNVRVFFDNWPKILFGKLSIGQKLMIIYVTLGNAVAPFVIVMTFFGFAGWFLGEPELFTILDVVDFFARFLYTCGFFFMGAVALLKRDMLKEIPHLILTAFSMGLVLAMTNSYAFVKACINSKLSWFCTQKTANLSLK
jgi:cellulose synthase/poly-beta-1,6-N-acetylglucosamine synthase-like glycosyltransferase